MPQIRRLTDRVGSFQQGRGTDRQDSLVHQLFRFQAVIIAPAIADCEIGIGRGEIGQAHIGRDPGLGLLMFPMEAIKAGRQPFRGEGRRR